MQRPDVRSTNKDKPTHPPMPSSAGITLSRICAIPASMDEGCAWMVVLRAYMICLRCMWGSVSTAPPDHFIVLPAGKAWQWVAGVSMMAMRMRCGFVETRCAPKYYEHHNQAHLMSSEGEPMSS